MMRRMHRFTMMLYTGQHTWRGEGTSCMWVKRCYRSRVVWAIRMVWGKRVVWGIRVKRGKRMWGSRMGMFFL
jgi:hypothetical protein